MKHTISPRGRATKALSLKNCTVSLRAGKFGRLLLAAAIASITGSVMAGPSGGVVVEGQGTIHSQDALTLINQNSQALTINWQNFDINAGETVTFLQPDANAYALNRVLSGDGTQIHGQLNANGRVFVLDANGVLFGEKAQVNVGSLVASTLDLLLTDGSGQYFEFTGQGNGASVTNLGSITAADGGAVALLGGKVNNQGVIRARFGNIALAAGEKITLDFAGDGLLNVAVDQATAQALVNNGGLIQADGGSVLMTAHASNALLQTVVNNTGVVQAQTLAERDGKIMLLGGFNGGTVQVSGTLDASAAEGNGGFIETSGAIVKVGAQANINASAAQGEAGTWLLDPTDLEISYSAQGANDEVSHAHIQALQNSLNGSTKVILETAATGDQAGNISLLDPLVWSSNATLILEAHNNIQLDYYLHAPKGSLTLSAGNEINTGAEGHINVHGFTLEKGSWQQVGAQLPMFNAKEFQLAEGSDFMRALGGTGELTNPWQITDIYGLQGLGTHLDSHAQLVNDIDATHLTNFAPIGSYSQPFAGSFDGQLFAIDHLKITSTNSLVGLFGAASGHLSGIGLNNVSVAAQGSDFVNATGAIVGHLLDGGRVNNSYASGNVTGKDNVGGLIGSNEGSLSHSYSTVKVTGDEYVGGLVGWNIGHIQVAYSTGEVTGDDQVGGIAGYNQRVLGDHPVGIIDQVYASGKVVAPAGVNVGGLVGSNFSQISDSYWDISTTGQIYSATGAGTAINVTAVYSDWNNNPSAYRSASYGSFDFANNWYMVEGASRPMLRALLNFKQDGDSNIIITNVYQLQGMAADPSANYVLGNNINASYISANSNSANVWGGQGFAPIMGFGGKLDGAGFAIDNLTINRSDANYVGLFGSLLGSALVSNLWLSNVDIRGQHQVGTLVGANSGSIDGVGVMSGSVTGLNSVGGLVGRNLHDGSISQSFTSVDTRGDVNVGGLVGINGVDISDGYISNSYATGSVTAVESAGGLVGRGDGTVENSYATGQVTGSGYAVGGLIGWLGEFGSVSNVYWDSFTSRQNDYFGSKEGNGAATALNGDWGGANPTAYQQDSYIGFDFDNVWFIADGSSRPMLRTFLNDNGDISNLYQLQGMQANLSGNYQLTQNIEVSTGTDISDVWGGRGFAPIGDFSSPFTGTLDGNNFAIENLTINRPDQQYVGLFSNLGAAAQISNLALVNAQVSGDFAAILAGWNDGNINNVSVSGSVVGSNYVAGLVAYNNGVIHNSHSKGVINKVLNSDDSWLGGLVAHNEGKIYTSYSTAALFGNYNVGGLIGLNQGLVVNSYSTGDVSLLNNRAGEGYIGGFVGFNDLDGKINSSYTLSMVNTEAANERFNAEGGFAGGNTGTITHSFWLRDGVSDFAGIGEEFGVSSLTELTADEFLNPASFSAWGGDINATGVGDAIWRIYEGSTAPLLRHFLSDIEVSAYDAKATYDNAAFEGLHTINGTTGNGVRYGQNYADFLAVFGLDGTPYQVSDAIHSRDLHYQGASQGAVNAGTYVLNAGKLWSTQAGFNIVTPESTLIIDPKDISLRINNASKIYGDIDPSFSWSISAGQLANGDRLTGSLVRNPGEIVGSYDIIGNLTGDLAGPNYNVTLNNGVFNITPRAIEISISDLEKTYGDLDPTLAWQLVSGTLAQGDTLDGTLVRGAGENAGIYAITGQLEGDLAGSNYHITLTDGKLVINQRALEITADSLAKIYGELDPALGWTISGGSLVAGDILLVELSRHEGREVGRYAIHINTAGNAAESGNYAINVVEGALDITPRVLTVTADDIRAAWNQLPAFSARVEGLAYDDSITDIFGNSLQVQSSVALDLPGDYILKPIAQLQSNNYQVNFVDGTLSLVGMNLGENYSSALTASQLPARNGLSDQLLARTFDARELLDGSEWGITLQVLEGGVRLDAEQLAALGLTFPEAVRFSEGSAEITEHHLADLRRFSEQLQRYPQVKILVGGHASNTGSLASNDPLSTARAASVASALNAMGLAQDRIRTESYGSQQPVASNDTAAGRQLNRRTEIAEDK